jgi:hypothetical protein
MRRMKYGPLMLLAALAAGCASGTALQKASPCDIPEWYTNIPQDPNFFFAVNTATSQDMQLASDKAVVAARAEIARQTGVKISGIQKRFDQEVGISENSQLMQQFAQATKTVVSESLSGSRIKNQKPCKDGATWRSYVLVEYPIGAANQALLGQIKANDLMRTQFEATKAYKELDDEVQKYEEWKKNEATLIK